jgi:di/tricarboxylate transporter
MPIDFSTISPHTWGLVFLVGAMVVTFITQRLPVDVTAMGVLLVLLVGGYVTPQEAFHGFSSPVVVVMVSTLFVVAALRATGVSDAMAKWIQRCAGASEPMVIAVVMIVSAVLSSCMNNTSAAALLMPAVAVLAHDTDIAPSRLFIPLAFAVTLGGTLTLIGSPPNIVAAELLRQRGLPAINFFDLTPYGAIGLVVGVLFMSFVGYRLLPIRKTQRRKKRITDLRSLYHFHDRLFSLRIPEGSPLDGRSLADLRFSAIVGGVVVTVIRAGRKLLSPRAPEKLFERDVLLVRGSPEKFAALRATHGLEVQELSAELVDQLVASSEIVRFKIGEVHTGSQTIVLRDVLRATGIVPLSVDRVSETGGWETAAPSWFLDATVHTGDTVVGSISGRFSEDSPSMDVELQVVHSPEELLKQSLHLIRIEKAGWSGAPIHRLAHETKLAILGRITPENQIEWLDVPSILPGGERGPVRLSADHVVRDGESYLISGPPLEAKRREALSTMELEAEAASEDIESEDVGIVELILTPRSDLIGRTLADLHFREKYDSQVLALWRDGKPLLSLSSQLPLLYGDALLVQGPRQSFDILAKDPDFLLLSEHRRATALSARSWFAVLALLMLMFLPPLTGIPVHEVAFLSACVVVFSRAISMEQVYREIDWRIVFLLALMMPLGAAIEHAAAADVVAGMVQTVSGAVPGIVLLALFMVLGSVVSQLIDSALAVIFLGPIAIALAQQSGQSPRALVMAVTLGASIAFVLPTSCRANLLVTGAGGYRTSDFIKIGLLFSVVVGCAMLTGLAIFAG